MKYGDIVNTSAVSFGKVIAVSGNSRKMQRLRTAVSRQREVQVLQKDITDKYMNTPRNGALSEAAGSGNAVCLFLTGDDIGKYIRSDKGWSNLDEILSHMSEYYDITKKSVKDVKNKILGWSGK